MAAVGELDVLPVTDGLEGFDLGALVEHEQADAAAGGTLDLRDCCGNYCTLMTESLATLPEGEPEAHQAQNRGHKAAEKARLTCSAPSEQEQ